MITTRPGRDLIEATLLRPRVGHFHAFCRDYGIPPGSITFDATTIFVASGPDGRPLELAVYAWLARWRLDGCPRADCPGCHGCFIRTSEVEGLAAQLRTVLAELGVRDERARLLKGWTGLDRFSQVRSKVNARIRAALRGEAWHISYVIERRTFA